MLQRRTAADLWRLKEILATVPIIGWATFHLWEQSAAFSGQEAFVARSTTTSQGTIPLIAEIVLAILPAVVWFALEVHLRISYEEPEDLRDAMAETPEVARRLGLLARVSTWVFFAWLLYHTTWLFAPKLSGGEPVNSWLTLQNGMGVWLHASLHAVGLTAFFVHVWASVPRVMVAMGWASGAEARRTARISGIIVAACYLVLFVHLAGLHASGTSTVWPI